MHAEPVITDPIASNELQTACSSYYLLLDLYWNRIGYKFGGRDVHLFRVTYKKLKAYLNFLNKAAYNKSPLKLSKKIVKAYHILGDIRNLQLLINKNLNDGELKQKSKLAIIKSKKAIKKLERLLSKSCSSRNLRKNWELNFRRLPVTVEVSAVKKYFIEKCAIAENILMQDIITDSQMHIIRKILKEVYYNSGLLRNHLFMTHVTAVIRNPGTDSILEALGHYQDLCSEIMLLGSELHEHGSSHLKSLMDEKQQIKNEIIRQIKLAYSKNAGCGKASLKLS